MSGAVEELRQLLLKELGEKAASAFTDVCLERLVQGGYVNEVMLKYADREGLTATLPGSPALVSILLAIFGGTANRGGQAGPSFGDPGLDRSDEDASLLLGKLSGIPMVHELEDILATGRLPVVQHTYTRLVGKHSSLQEHLRVSTGDLAIAISHAIGNKKPLPPDATEVSTGYRIIEHFLLMILRTLDTCAPKDVRLGLVDYLNSTVKNVTAGSAPVRVNTRPDTLIIAGLLVMFVGEDKRHKDLMSAKADIEDKMRQGLPWIFYGDIPYIFTYAAAGEELQFGVLMSTGQVHWFSQIINMNDTRDMVTAIQTAVNVHRVMHALLTKAPPPERRVVIMQQVERPHDTSIVVYADYVEKRLRNFDTFLTNYQHSFKSIQVCDAVLLLQNKDYMNLHGHHLTGFADVEMAYKVAEDCPFMAHAKTGYPEVSKKRQRSDSGATPQSVYKLQLDTLGYHRNPGRLSEAELRLAMYASLTAASKLAAAGLCHRDFRWQNLLWRPKPALPFIIDYELACEEGLQVQHSALIDWDDQTLEAGLRYTHCSDVYQIGLMMKQYLLPLSVAGQEVMKLMISHEESADRVLKHSWFETVAQQFPEGPNS